MFRQCVSCVLVPLLVASIVLLGACASDSAGEPTVKLLDAKQEHYGKTYAEWSAAWIEYVNSFHAPKCANPEIDPTGANCAVDQDPKSPVFFLAGAFGGAVKRKCPVPKDKALFLPIVTLWGDNAGVPADMLVSEAELKSYVQGVYDRIEPKRLELSVDGEAVDNLEQGGVRSAPYTVDIPKGDNSYSCGGVEGVEGKFDGFVAGYWAMLAPLSAGTHSIDFGVMRGVDPLTGDPSQPSFELDIRYELEVE